MKGHTRRGFLKTMGVGAAGSAAPGLVRSGSTDGKKPNIILVLTDGQGWTDTSVQRMAGEGMVFSNGYCPAPTCTPTRCSIKFGKTPARLGQTVVHDVLAQSRGIDCKNEVSSPQMIKPADPRYRTAHFGKWGFPPRPPEHAGYDVTDGNTNNVHGDWLSKNDGKPLPQNDPKRIFSLTKRANAFMAKCVKAGRPD